MQEKHRTRGTGSIRERNGRLYGKFYVGDRQIERAIGPATMSARQREDRMREIADGLSAARALDERVTINEASAAHIAARKIAGKKKNTTDNYERDTRVHYVPFFGETVIDRITERDIEGFLASRLALGLSPKTVRNQLNHLHSIFKFAIRRHWATFNPVEMVDRPADAYKDPEIRFLTVEQIDELLRVGAEGIDRQRHTVRSLERGAKIRQMREKGLEWGTIALAMDCSPATAIYLSRARSEDVVRDLLAATDRVLWLAAAMTGLRQGELLSVRWRHIDWTAQTIRVFKNSSAEGTVKSAGSFRSVPMALRVARELELHFQAAEFRRDDDLVFGHPLSGKRLDRTAVTTRFQAALDRAKLPPLTFHELRHTFGTTMAANPNVPLRQLQEWMGHADIKTTLVYAHYKPRPHEAALIDQSFAGESTNSLVHSLKQDSTEINWNPEDPVDTGGIE